VSFENLCPPPPKKKQISGYAPDKCARIIILFDIVPSVKLSANGNILRGIFCDWRSYYAPGEGVPVRQQRSIQNNRKLLYGSTVVRSRVVSCNQRLQRANRIFHCWLGYTRVGLGHNTPAGGSHFPFFSSCRLEPSPALLPLLLLLFLLSRKK